VSRGPGTIAKVSGMATTLLIRNKSSRLKVRRVIGSDSKVDMASNGPREFRGPIRDLRFHVAFDADLLASLCGKLAVFSG